MEYWISQAPMLPYWTLLGAVVALATCLAWRWRNRSILKLSASLPGPTTLPGFGNALLFVGKSVDFLQVVGDLSERYGEHSRLWIGTQFNVIVSHPHDIRVLLTSNKLNEKGPLYRTMDAIIGPGILSGGETWRSHRKIAKHSYNKKSVQHFNEVFNKETEHLIQILMSKDPNTTFDIYRDVVKTTTQCVCQTLMGLSKNESLQIRRLDEVVNWTPEMYTLIFAKMTKWWYWPPFFQLLGFHRLEEKYRTAVHEMTLDIIRKRMKHLEDRRLTDEDLQSDVEVFGVVDRFILSKELTEREMIEESFSLFTTSQEASAKIAASMLFFLAKLPDWQERVYSEILEVVGPEDRWVGEEEFRRMPALEAVYKEALRYLPIASCIQRTVQEDFTLEKAAVTIPRGASVIIPIHALHRNPKYWPDPNRVMPERFLPEEVKKRDPNVFVPFSLGPMDCLGRVYATSLIKTLVTRTVRHLQLTPATPERLQDLPLDVAISTKFRDGCNVRVCRRRSEN